MPADRKTPLKVLFLASEAEPFFKVGGLGDYAGSLPAALAATAEKNGQPLDIRVGLPFHQTINADTSVFSKVTDLKVPKKKGSAKGSVFTHTYNGVPHYFIRRAGRAGGFSKVYSTSPVQDARKYVFFSLASLELTRLLDWQPDVLHANDWHTAVAVDHLQRSLRQQPFFNRTRSLQVIHNLPFMGAGSGEVLDEFGIPPLPPTAGLPSWSLHFPLILGMQAADHITAVSPSYAEELRDEEFGNGLKDFFRINQERTSGILNGIDTQKWDPSSDALLTANFTADNLEARKANKSAVLELAGFDPQDTRPLLVAVTRLDIQKGTDLLMAAIPELTDLDWNLVVLGTGDPDYEKTLMDLQERYPQRLRVFLEFNAALSHQLYAGGDIFLMPSRYEPCGLSQMIAMRYGCIPLTRAVGGLRDTIDDVSAQTRTGFLFEEASREAFIAALRKALRVYHDPATWQRIQVRAMAQDFSWENSAAQYLQLYQSLLE
ncbi:MAG: starch synthase [Chloroflexota bacterium]|nr:starch synthase [Chloroflexota bacterium]